MSLSKVALVTGGSKGIGAAIARRLSADGFSVAINYAKNAEPAQALVAELQKADRRAFAVQCNVANTDDVIDMFDIVEKELGPIKVLINNAGIMINAPVAQSEEADFDEQIAVNLKGTFNTLKQAANRMPNGGRIVNISTSVVGLKLENYGIYAATKSAVETLSAILSKELRGKEITVNTVAPGPTATDLFLNGKSQEMIDRLAKMSPLERLATPDDIARAVAFLVGPDGAWINGQVLRANGGII
ncbi:SDR family oxidoreductase [Paraglaciecola polaris]|uniref:3-oxoacyl-[acyl-carrier protein] reductase n=1 Tax=Paraglaciecola polaris LMG 21857 TaxID=1129793 RepID=K6ZBA3_9ALTE|nr:SDR family oxidoreductase [Paraglaciecola polaris]GAC33371.1 3-oxoacyl-[acyl-carrier protein] reductase [Paraglaciecola polaris LMG 21857]|tara:strand:+ start:4553 stop:5287 length:735 start_codon:yes stop_codon:yes gene_type:complete